MLVEVVTTLACAAVFCFVLLEKPVPDSDLPVRELTPEFLASLQVPAGIRWLGAQQYQCLVAICDTFVPAFVLEDGWQERLLAAVAGNTTNAERTKRFLPAPRKQVARFFETSASDVGVAPVLATIVQDVLPELDRIAMSVLLFMLSHAVLCFPLTGYLTPFQELPFPHRQRILQSWRDSYLQPMRKAYQGLKRLTGAVYLAYPDPATKTNRSWEALQYEPRTVASVKKDKPDFAPAPPLNNLVSPAELASSTESTSASDASSAPAESVMLTCDVVVVGSGCGGGVVAELLTKAGLKVIVVDKGGYFTENDFARWTEFEALQHSFEQQGVFSSSDGNVAILAGSCVGGGSVINWGASFRTPAHVRREWVERFGLDAFKQGGEFDEALDFVCQRLNVNIDYSHRNDVIPGKESFKVNLNNELLYRGATQLGKSCKPIPRNVKSCINCGSCNLGCAYGAKQSTILAFFQQVRDATNLQIIPWTHVDRVLVEDGSAVGVVATSKFPRPNSPSQTFPDDTWQSVSVTIRSTAVVSAAGALHTPALLLRSGLKHRKLGKHLCLHPVLGVGGLAPGQDTGLNQGVSMGTYVDDFISMNNTGYGVVPETPPIHSSILGLGLPWDDAVKYRYSLTLYKHFAVFINISRDRSQESNRVTIDSKGRPLYHYTITPEDEKVLLAGQAETMRMMRAAGSSLVMGFKEAGAWYSAGEDDGEFEEYIKQSQSDGVKPNRTLVFSAHQMGSCRLSSRREDGPLKPNGETWEVSNLFVADASTFPTSLGVNPMVTIEAVAYMVGKKVLEKLNVPLPAPDLVVPGQEFPSGPTLHGRFGNVDPSKIQW